MKYVELHARSAFSFLQGACPPEDYIELAKSQGHHALALTDIDGVYGSPRMHRAAKKAGIQAHVGADITLAGGSQVTLLVESQAGYQNLTQLVTRTKLEAREANAEDLAEFSPGLLALSLSPQRAELEDLVRIYGPESVYVELQRHYDRKQELRNQAALETARALRLPVVATNGVCHATAIQREIFDVFTCLHHKTTLAQAGRLLATNSERRLKSPTEMVELFSDLPQAIANTLEISSRLRFTLNDLGYRFPDYPLPLGETVASYLYKLSHEGARRRYQPYYERARQQVDRELALIEKLGLGGYFLIVWDIVRFCREKGILCQGRGSAANSAVCYCLGITAVDPVGMDLLFERFLSEERGEWPDIDIDLPSGDKRELAIQYVYERYGERGAAMTANVITYRGRSAAREAGKVLGFDVKTLDRLASLAPMWGWHDAVDDKRQQQFRAAGLDLDNFRVKKFLDIVTGMQDMPRHLGQHSGGMIVCQGRLDRVVPLQPASMPNRVVVQWDKEDCADLGLIKVDLLGLGMMAVLEDCLKLIRSHWREEIDLGRLPADDPKVYETLCRADTIGMFQVESRAQQATLPRLRPLKFYDLVVEVALIRPGPIVGQMVHPYLNRRTGKEAPDALHPLLEPVLARTLGVPLFQEQLLRMAMIVSDFTGGEAEELRRAMGFKRSEARMSEIESRLRSGMARKGIVSETQDRIVRSITSFALYGFPESHAASFALIAYASAWLKVHYLPAFTCALLNNQPMGFYSPAVLIKDAQRHGLRVLPVDVNISEWDCTVEGPERHLRLGLRYVRGLRAESGAAIVDAKPFADVDDLARRVPKLRRDELQSLAATGALAKLATAHRRDALWKAARAGRVVGPLLEEVPELNPEAPLEQMSIPERLAADYQGSGLTIGPHPFHYRRAELDAMGVTPARDLDRVPNGGLVRVAGAVVVRQRPGTAKGIVFASLEDETGIFNVVVMPDEFEKYRVTLVTEPCLVIEGKIQKVDKVIHVRAKRIQRLEPYSPVSPSHDFK